MGGGGGQQLGFVLDELDFSKAEGLVDPFETTIRYLGALVSTVDLLDANFTVFETPLRAGAREGLLAKAVGLAGLLGPGFDSPSGMPWPRINFTAGVGCREEEGARPYPKFWHATVGPARAGSNWLENSRLSALTGNGVYRENATRSWRWVEAGVVYMGLR